MKKLLFAAFSLVSMLFLASCSNDDITIDKNISKVENAVSLSIDLTNFYSGYTFNDTKHNIDQIAEAYRTFNSENEMYIQVLTLIYDKLNQKLVDTNVEFVTNTNPVTTSLSLFTGEYYAITILSFATKDKESFWEVQNNEMLTTAKLIPRNRYSKWSILSMSTENITVSRDQAVRLYTIPRPLGALVYLYYQNFQYIDEDSYGDVADNKIRQIVFLTKRRADSYNLDPFATSKFNFAEETTSTQWYINKNSEPQSFNNDWTYFKTNLYSYCYILDPEQTIKFGIVRDGDNGFDGYGEQQITYTPGVTYLAYWDYFKIGNPYLGIADNNHWNDYKVTKLFKTPYTEWGTSKSKVKEQMSLDNYSLIGESDNYLQYNNKFKESYSVYNFSSSDKLSFVDIVFDSSVSIADIKDFINKKENATYLETSDGIIYYLTNDEKSVILIGTLDLGDGVIVNIVEYVDNTGISSAAKSKMKKSFKERALELKFKLNK